MAPILKDRRFLLLTIIIVAFTLRLGAKDYFLRMSAAGDDLFWHASYREYNDLARNFRQRLGLCIYVHNYALISNDIDPDVLGIKCAHLPPMYPLFLSMVQSVSEDLRILILAQAVVSVGTVVCLFLLGDHLFGTAIGLLASLMAAIYPYYIWHDTSLHESGFFTFWTALSMLILYKASASGSRRLWLLAGISFGTTILVRASILPFACLVVLWVCASACGSFRDRLAQASCFAVALVAVLTPWLVRNSVILGAPALTTQTGRFLWIGNNPHTFSHYPEESIDVSESVAWGALTMTEITQIRNLASDEIAQSRWFLNRGTRFMVDHIGLTLQGFARKFGTAFSWNFSPAKDVLTQRTYFFSYLPVFVLGVCGMLLTGRRWRQLSLIYCLFLSFIVGTVLFWAHTSHRIYLDIYLMIFAAYTCKVVYSRGLRRVVSGD